MSRDAYVGGTRSPRGVRLPTADRSPSRGGYPGGAKPLRPSRSGNNSPDHSYGYHHQSTYYRDEDLGSPMLEERGRPMAVGPGHHRSRSATRPANPMTVRYQSLDRGPAVDHDREFLPIRDRRDEELASPILEDRGRPMSMGPVHQARSRSATRPTARDFMPIRDRRDRSLDRGLYFDDEPYSSRSARQSPTMHQPFLGELQHQNSDLQRELGNLKKELELTNQKLGSSMHSIKTFWSPELKKERALRKEESTKYSLINDQLKLLSSENQKQAMLVRQLEEELRMRMRGPSIEMQQQMEALYQENEHLTREIAILRDTIKELELRIETQKQTLQARDESIKKLLEMLQNKGMGKEEERQMFQQMQAMAQKQLDEFRVEIQRRDQEILAMGAKMKTLEEQHQDYQRHISVLKESLCAKEEHYNMLQADVEEMRQRLEEKNRHIEKKTQQTQQERARAGAEIAELREHMDIKDRKINVLQRKMELLETQKKMQSANVQKPTEDVSGQMKRLEEERKLLDDYKKQVDEQKKAVDSKHRQIEEKERQLAELDKQLKKRKEQMDQLELSLQKAGGSAAAVGEMNKKLTEAEKNLEKAQEEAKRSAGEMERLLQLVQMSQEEQNTKEKQIMDLQQALKAAQTKLKNQQTVNAQLEEQRKREENSSNSKGDIDELKLELDSKNDHIDDLKRTIEQYTKQIDSKNKEIETLQGDLKERKAKNDMVKISKSTEQIKNLQNELDKMNEALNNDASFVCVEKILERADPSSKRIKELENALRETIQISTEREMVLRDEERKRKNILEKVFKLEQRLLSLQAAQAMKCHSCRQYVRKMATLEKKLSVLISERTDQLKELNRMKMDALESAISEKDAHLALLEITGIRTAKQAEEVEKLHLEKRRLVERLKQENVLSVSLHQKKQEDDGNTSSENSDDEKLSDL